MSICPSSASYYVMYIRRPIYGGIWVAVLEVVDMLNFCMKGCEKAAGLAILAFSAGIIAGMFLPPAAIVIAELCMLLIFGYFCLFKW